MGVGRMSNWTFNPAVASVDVFVNIFCSNGSLGGNWDSRRPIPASPVHPKPISPLTERPDFGQSPKPPFAVGKRPFSRRTCLPCFRALAGAAVVLPHRSRRMRDGSATAIPTSWHRQGGRGHASLSRVGTSRQSAPVVAGGRNCRRRRRLDHRLHQRFTPSPRGGSVRRAGREATATGTISPPTRSPAAARRCSPSGRCAELPVPVVRRAERRASRSPGSVRRWPDVPAAS